MFETCVKKMIELCGEDVNRQGLIETPARVAKSFRFLTSGYSVDIGSLIKTFDDDTPGAATDGGLILMKNIEFYSLCEHHLLPFFGKAHVAYIPSSTQVLGASKLARIVDAFARRFQIQERLGRQIANTIAAAIPVKGVACVLEAQHMCMLMRGVQKQNSVMDTVCLTGVFLTKTSARNELMMRIGYKK